MFGLWFIEYTSGAIYGYQEGTEINGLPGLALQIFGYAITMGRGLGLLTNFFWGLYLGFGRGIFAILQRGLGNVFN